MPSYAVNMRTFIYICIYICVYVWYMYRYVSVYAIYVCMCMCICMSMYMYIYIRFTATLILSIHRCILNVLYIYKTDLTDNLLTYHLKQISPHRKAIKSFIQTHISVLYFRSGQVVRWYLANFACRGVLLVWI